MSKTVVVFGATGTSGGGAMRKLVDAGHEVLAVTREVESEKAKAVAARGARPVAADLDDRASIRKVIDGADAVYMAGPALLNRWDIGQALHGINVADASIEVGTPHLIYQSSVVWDARGVLSAGAKRAIEERIAETDLPATIVRPAWFMDNFFNYIPIDEQGDKLSFAMALPVEKDICLVSSDDIGRAAVAVIGDPGRYIGQDIDLVADLGSANSMARIIGEEVGRETVSIELPLGVLAEHWPEGHGLYKWLSERETKETTAALRALIGEPTSFRDWTRANLAPWLIERFRITAA